MYVFLRTQRDEKLTDLDKFNSKWVDKHWQDALPLCYAWLPGVDKILVWLGRCAGHVASRCATSTTVRRILWFGSQAEDKEDVTSSRETETRAGQNEVIMTLYYVSCAAIQPFFLHNPIFHPSILTL